MSRVFKKTPLGVDAYTTHAHLLTQPQRALLVMIDGKRSATQLRKFGGSFGNVNTILAELYNAGFIELDPAYVERMLKLQSEIAREEAELPGTLAAETIIGGARSLPPALAAVPAQPIASALPQTGANGAAKPANPPKRDLRDLALLGEPDPTPSQFGARAGANTLALSLDPVDSDDGKPIGYASDAAIENARKLATRFVFDQIGSSGTALCFALEKAMTLQRLQEVGLVAEQTLSDMKGSETAFDFRRQFRATLRG